jgi:very-short-patch-repair endonuclease
MLENPTAAEVAIEPSIAALGKRYRAQHAFIAHKHFADFALLDDKILIEVDGATHNAPAQKEKDLRHMLATTGLGWVTVRVTNEQALSNPKEALRGALDDAQALRSLGKEALVLRYQGLLEQLHRDYPHLLAAPAKRSKYRRPRATKARSRAASAQA